MIVQIRSFLNQVCELNPKVNAAGFFDIGKSLFPAVIKLNKENLFNLFINNKLYFTLNIKANWDSSHVHPRHAAVLYQRGTHRKIIDSKIMFINLFLLKLGMTTCAQYYELK